jgi:hypothetical protein
MNRMTWTVMPKEARPKKGEKGRPPPGGIAGAVKARLRGVEPDAFRRGPFALAE